MSLNWEREEQLVIIRRISESVRQIQELDEVINLKIGRYDIKHQPRWDNTFKNLSTNILYDISSYTEMVWTYESAIDYISQLKKYQLENESDWEYEQRIRFILTQMLNMKLLVLDWNNLSVSFENKLAFHM